MLNSPLRLLVFLTLASLLFAECTKPTLVGSELVDLAQSPLERADTFTMELRSFPVDSFESYRPLASLQTSRYPFGYVIDPVFGTSRTTFYLEFVPSYGFNEPDFTGAVLDSLVLSVAADTVFFSGTPPGTATYSVHRLLEPMPRDTLSSRRSFAFDPQPSGQYTGPIWPIPTQRIREYISSSTGDTITRRQFRFHLDPQIGQELMALDSTRLVDDSLFIQTLRGFALTIDQPTQAYIGLLFNNLATSLTLYYTVQDSIRRQARWTPVTLPSPPGLPRISHIHQEVDRQTATYPTLLTANSPQDTLHFVQGMSGMEMEISFPYLATQELILVNRAMLELTICPLDGEDPEVFGPLDQLEIYTYDGSGKLTLIDDVTFALKNGTFGLQNYFGGTPVKSSAPGGYTYTCNLSAQVQKILEGRASSSLFVRARGAAQTPKRAIFYGNGSQYPPRLTITYTRINP